MVDWTVLSDPKINVAIYFLWAQFFAFCLLRNKSLIFETNNQDLFHFYIDLQIKMIVFENFDFCTRNTWCGKHENKRALLFLHLYSIWLDSPSLSHPTIFVCLKRIEDVYIENHNVQGFHETITNENLSIKSFTDAIIFVFILFIQPQENGKSMQLEMLQD